MRLVDRITAIGFALVFACLGSVAHADEAVYRHILQTFIETDSLDGGVVLVADEDGRTIVAHGIADRATGTPMSADSRFYVASTGKMVVAAAVLAYVQAGDIALDQPVWPFIKTLPGIERLANSDLVTLRQLLNHTSGVADYLDEDFIAASAEMPTKKWTAAEALEFAYDFPAAAAPGEVFEYNNANYVLLGHILAEIAGSLPAALDVKIFRPAGMIDVSVGAPDAAQNLVRGYQGDDDKSAQAWASVLGDGPLVMPLADMEKFMFALFRDEKIIGADMLATMLTGSEVDDSYGLGMGLDGDAFGVWYGHSGGYDGYEADVRYYPEAGLVLVMAINGNQDSDISLLDDVAAAYFAE